MTITLEMIDELRKRVNVSYEEAKDALEKNNGDIVEAIIYLEKNSELNFTKPESDSQTVSDVILKCIRWSKRWIKKGNSNHIVIKKNDKTILNLSLTLFVVLSIIGPYIVIPGIILALFTGHKINFRGNDIEKTKANEISSKIECSVNDIKDEFNK